MATIRKRGSSWQAIVRRREFSESRTFLSKSDATAWATELEAKIIRNSAGLPDSSKNFTFNELIDDYIETSKKSQRGLKRTKEKDERVRGTAARALLDRGWGKPKVEVVTDEKQDYIAALMAVNERLRHAQ